MVRRAGARPGDVVFVSGTIGDAALGLRIRRGELQAGPGGEHLTGRLLEPEPRLALVAALRRHASSAMDVSDGLIGDLGHLCETSGVGAEVDAEAVPLSPPARQLLAADPSLLPVILNGGEDFEVLATVPERDADAYAAAASAAGVPVTPIGHMVAGEGPPRVRGAGGRLLTGIGSSFTHF
jgi:thiamine-monophosphate kinase